jgi:hypothetical protein
MNRRNRRQPWLDRQRRAAVATIAVTLGLLVLFGVLSPDSQSSGTAGAGPTVLYPVRGAHLVASGSGRGIRTVNALPRPATRP